MKSDCQEKRVKVLAFGVNLPFRLASHCGPRAIIAAFALGCAASISHAAEPELGGYVGGGAGLSSFHSDFAAQVNNAYDGSGFTVVNAQMTDDRGTGWKVFAGWRFHRYAAVEVGYVDFGKATTHYEIGDPGVGTAVRDGRYELSGVEVSFLGVLPVGEQVTLFAKVGGLASKLKYSESGVDQFGTPASFAADDNQVVFLYGLGAGVNFTDALSARIEWQRVTNVGERFALTATGNGEFDHVDLVSASLIWRFR